MIRSDFLENMSGTISKITQIALRCKDKAPAANYKCSICRDTGSIIIDQAEGQPLIKKCTCRKNEEQIQQWIYAGFNIASSDKNFKTFKVNNKVSRRMRDMALDYIENFEVIQFSNNHSIGFLGHPGSGKTHCCFAIALELIKKEFNPMYFPYREAITELKQNIMDEIKYREKMDKYKKSKILIIDDLFKGGTTESDIRIMFEIINYRYLNRLPIVVSSEYLSEELLNIDTAIGSRIIEICKGRLLDIYGEEYNQRLL